MTVETTFDVRLVARLALPEKQIRQNYRPIFAVHIWFARRPGTLFPALAPAGLGNGPLSSLDYKAHDSLGRKVAEPLMGGRSHLVEANRLGCEAAAFDINPMASRMVCEAVAHLNANAFIDRNVDHMAA